MMRLRIILTFLGLALFVTACNNSKKHDNTDAFDLEQQQEAMTRQTQQLLKKDLLKCSFISNPNQNRVDCPTLAEHEYENNYNFVPSCPGLLGTFTNNCRGYERIDLYRKNTIMKARNISLEAVYAYEVIPVRIKNNSACYMDFNIFDMEEITNVIGTQQNYDCDGILLKNVAGMTSNEGTGAGKKYFGHIIIAPINPNSAPAQTFAERIKLALGHISPSEAIRLQQPRYGNKSFNPQNYAEGYAHITELRIKNIRYSMRDLELIDLRTGLDYQITTPKPMFAYATASLKYGYDYRSYNLANIGYLTPNYLTEETFKNYVLETSQEQQERYSRQID